MSGNRKLIGKSWKGFADVVLSARTPEAQRTDMRRAFFAGSQALLDVYKRIGEDDISEEDGVEILNGIHEELIAFAASIGTPREGL